MTLDDVLTLSRAGFTADQIKGLMQPESKPTEEPEQKPAEEPEPKKTEEDGTTLLNKIIDRLDNLEQGIKDTALKNTSINKKAGDTVDEILASIINPPKKEDK